MSHLAAESPPGQLGSAFKIGAETNDEVALMVMLLDLQDAAPEIRRLRSWALAAADVQPGETVIDVGSGTGTMTRALADAVGPTGRATGVEPNPRLRGIAEERVAEGGSSVVFVDARAAALPMADSSVDLVWCERVLQHLDDPAAAVQEFGRVLRPGGRAVLLDSDHASRVTSDIDPDVELQINAAFMARTANPRAARHIPRQAIAAGLQIDPEVGSAALVMPPEIALRSPLLMVAADQAVTDGRITREQADEAVGAHRAAAVAGCAFSAVTIFGFLARKP